MNHIQEAAFSGSHQNPETQRERPLGDPGNRYQELWRQTVGTTTWGRTRTHSAAPKPKTHDARNGRTEGLGTHHSANRTLQGRKRQPLTPQALSRTLLRVRLPRGHAGSAPAQQSRPCDAVREPMRCSLAARSAWWAPPAFGRAPSPHTRALPSWCRSCL